MTSSDHGPLDALDTELRLADAPAVFCVWVSEAGEVSGVVEACRADGRAPRVLSGRAGLDLFLGGDPGSASGPVLIERGLSSVPRQERRGYNRARQLLLGARVVVLVEPAGEESSLRTDYPDIFSIARSHHRVGAPRDLDEPGWIAVDPRPAAPVPAGMNIPCPRCGRPMEKGRTTLTFHEAPEASRTQAVDGWICPCGERYVPGPAGREAHARAFGLANGAGAVGRA